jgi:undecaprenyl-diphosphatase
VPTRDAIARFDRVVDSFFDQVRHDRVVHRVFYVASELGDWSLVWHLVGAGQGVVVRNGVNGAVRLSAALGAESALVNGVVKAAFRRTRPIVQFERPHKLRVPRSSSFPSGHASSAFLAAGLLSDQHKGKAVFYALAVVVAASRIHVGIHHASDVVAGAALGAGLAVVVKRLWPLGAVRVS